MNPNRIFAIFIRQWFLLKTNPIRFLNVFLWIFIDILQWGFISKYLGTFGGATFSIVTVLLGSIILWDFMSRIQQGIMMAFFEDNWSKNFINFFASPLKIREYLSGLVLFSLITGMVGFLVMLIIAEAFFDYNFFEVGILILPFFASLIIFAIAIGIFISGLVFRYGSTAEWLSWPIPFVISIFCGVYYPLSTLPQAMQFVSKLIPASYIFENFRSLSRTPGFSAENWNGLVISLALSLFYLLASYIYFYSVYRRNLKTGSIARFGAEY